MLISANGAVVVSTANVPTNAAYSGGIAFDPVTGAMFVSSSVGALSTANTAAAATANVTAIQAALTAGGLVQITTPGTYYINSGLTVYSNTSFVLGDGVQLAILPGLSSRFTLIRNANWGSTNYILAASGLTSTNGKTGQAVFTTGTNFAVGDYVMFNYAVPDAYNGIWRVLTVSTTTLANDTITFRMTSTQATLAPALTTPATVLTGAPSSQIIGCKADVNIHIDGGIWNFGGYDQGSYAISNNLNDVMVHLRRVYNSSIRNTLTRGAHYSFMVANAYGFEFQNNNAEDCGNLGMFSGSGRDIYCIDNRGRCFDNILAVQQGDYAGYLDTLYTQSDFSGIVIDGLHSDGAYLYIKTIGTYGAVQSVFRDVTLRNLTGWISGPYDVVIADDALMVPYNGASVNPGTVINKFLLENVSPSRAVSGTMLFVKDANASTNVGNLIIRNCSKPMISSGTGQAMLYALRASSTTLITNLVMESNDVSSDAVANCYMILQTAVITNARILNNRCNTVSALWAQSTTANGAVTAVIENNDLISCNGLWSNGVASNVLRVGYNNKSGGGGAMFIATGGSATIDIWNNGYISPANWWVDTNWSSAAPFFNTPQRHTVTTSAATQAINYAQGNVQEVTLTQATQQLLNSTRSPARSGATLDFFLIQDGTGGRAVTWDTTYKNLPALGTGTANQRCLVRLIWSGANWWYEGGSTWA